MVADKVKCSLDRALLWERQQQSSEGHSASVPGTSAERVANMAADAIREGHHQDSRK